MDEIASLMWIKHYVQRGEHDVLVVDCAPTGETLQLLTFPDAARWWLDKVYPWERRAMKMARPVLQPLMDFPLPSDEIFASLKDLLLDLDGMRKVLTDPDITTVRIVLNLEKMVVKEAKRAFSYLSLFGYVTDAVIVNRLLPGELYVTVGNYRREISLPRVLAQRDTAGAAIDDGKLRVRFTKRKDAKR